MRQERAGQADDELGESTGGKMDIVEKHHLRLVLQQQLQRFTDAIE